MIENNLIPFLGAGANLCNRPATFTDKHLPNAEELSASIAEKFLYPFEDKKNLPLVSWYAAKLSKAVLQQQLHEIFTADYPFNDVHSFFAELPRKLDEKGYGKCHQIIVTTNYDEMLERAFREKGRSFDVLSYIAHSEDLREIGKFKYVPDGGDPEIIYDRDMNIPIDRTIILKIHGAVAENWGDGSFVITEDDYIDYLARMKTETDQIPTVVMHAMKNRSFLFLGYSLTDWNLRVLLNNIRQTRRFPAMSWAIMKESEDWEHLYWEDHDVELYELSLEDYFKVLNEELDAYPAK